MDEHLILFSGGKDSFMTAAMYAEQNVPVVLLSMNNGAVAAEEHLLHGAKRLQNRYGTELVKYAGVCATYGAVQRLRKDWIYADQAVLAETCPHVCNNQFQCLHCQSAMWVTAIAYAVAKGIKNVAAGYHAYDPFCTGCWGWVRQVSDMATDYGIQARFPLWDENDWQDGAVRDLAMMDRGFIPQVLEPKCLLGMPAEGLEEPAARQLVRYFDEHVKPKMPDLIDTLIPHFRVARLSEKSLQPLDYPPPKHTGGMY